MSTELFNLLDEIEEEKGISKDVILEALEDALIMAYKKNFGAVSDIKVKFEDSGEIKIYTRRTVVEEVEDKEFEISLEDAQKYSGGYEIGDVVEIEDTPKSFGRIAAQTARQVVLQRLREAEREKMMEEYTEREKSIVSAVVRKIEGRNVMLEIDGVESVLMPNEQTKVDRYEIGERYKVFVIEVTESNRGIHLVVSRSHPGLVKCLLELEVPEFADGIIEFRGIAREAGSRAKIAVSSNKDYVDPVGTCIGTRGMRIQNITEELRGEKLDIVRYSDDIVKYIKNALSPAAVIDVYEDEETKSYKAIIPDSHLSLAIGRDGQNVRLAARLTGKKIELISIKEEEMEEKYGISIDELEAESIYQTASALHAENDYIDADDVDYNNTSTEIPPEAISGFSNGLKNLSEADMESEVKYILSDEEE